MKVPDAILHCAATQPDLIAIEDEHGALTYGALASRALRAADILGRTDRPGSPVAICLPRGRNVVVAALGAMLAGRPYAPVDPLQPAGRTRALLEASAINTLVTTDDSDISRNVLTPAHLASGKSALPSAAPAPAYIVHTSGSTGAPKGVVVGHQSLSNLVQWHNRTYRLRPGMRHLHTAGLGFDAAVWEIWPCLCAGATLVVAPDDVRLSPVDLVEFARAHDVQILFAGAPIAEMLVDLDADTEIPWQTLLTGGDVLHMKRLPREWRIVNHYGPAEATVCTTCHPVAELPTSGLPPIGRPIDGVRVLLRDERGEPVAAGDIGEIYIGGRALALGYHRRPEETARRFLRLADEPGRWYRTGDLARMAPDGNLIFHGRDDGDQLQIRGVRVEAGEVEAALVRHPQIRQAAVAPLGDPGSGRTLGALLVVAERCPPLAELRHALSADLPASVIPTRVLSTERLPLTENGKIDRAAVQRTLSETKNDE